ncbi:hypothetical protein E2320_017820 [Naja naja]|nr:hypothetical protein E2320_017820 [Naja naja]
MSSAVLLVGVLCILGANGSASEEKARSILKFGQFGGKPCIVALSDKQPCETRTPCPDKRGHCGKQEFECDNGRLVCNTEDDCGDFSDEDNCDETKRPPCGDRDIDAMEKRHCGTLTILAFYWSLLAYYVSFINFVTCKPSRDIEESDILTANMNVLGMKPAQKALYNEFYNGICDRVRDGNTATYYRKPWNVAFLSYETRGDKKFTSEFYSDQGKTMEKIISTKSHSLDVSFSLQLKPPLFPVSGGFETGVNFAKSSSLSDFLEKTKGKRGTIGGKYELIYVLDNRTMTSQRSANEKKGIIQEVISLIQGGTTATLTKLNEMLSSNVNSVDVEQYVEWAATLPQAPAMAPISELIPLNIPDSRIKKVNLDRAVEDYVAEYSVCKCKPCLHGGTAMLIEGKCECACTPFYKGEACEIPLQI